MASVRGLDRAGSLFFLSFLFLVATFIGLIQGARCGNWPCFYIFLAIALFFFFWAIESAMA